MITKTFGEFILRSRMRANISAVVCALIPFLGWLAAVIVALVTVRKGYRAGFVVLLWAALPSIAWAIDGSFWFLITNVLCGTLLVWLLALVLLATKRWTSVFCAAGALGLLGVLLVHLVIPHPHLWWMDQLKTFLSNSQGVLSSGADIKELLSVLKPLMPFITGIQMAVLLIAVLAELVIACGIDRVLRAKLGFSSELKHIRFGKVGVTVLLLFAVLAMIGPLIFRDFFPVIVLPFLLAGVSVAHCLLSRVRSATLFLSLFYIGVFLAALFMPFLLVSLAVLAVMDSVMNLRVRVTRNS